MIGWRAAFAGAAAIAVGALVGHGIARPIGPVGDGCRVVDARMFAPNFGRRIEACPGGSFVVTYRERDLRGATFELVARLPAGHPAIPRRHR